MMTAGNSSIPNFKRNQPHPLPVSSNPTAPIKQTQSPPTNTAIYTFPPPQIIARKHNKNSRIPATKRTSHRFSSHTNSFRHSAAGRQAGRLTQPYTRRSPPSSPSRAEQPQQRKGQVKSTIMPMRTLVLWFEMAVKHTMAPVRWMRRSG